MLNKKMPINVDLNQYEEIRDYCNVTGATKACVVREAVGTWLATVKDKRLKAFGKRPEMKKQAG
jgi:hypothetical protein